MKHAQDSMPWQPSNSSDGLCFIELNCSNCGRDKPMSEGCSPDECSDDELCGILGRSFAGRFDEWRESSDGRLFCTDFVPRDGFSRDELTVDWIEQGHAQG